MQDDFPSFIAEVGALAMASTTYEWILNFTGVLVDPSRWEYAMSWRVGSSTPDCWTN